MNYLAKYRQLQVVTVPTKWPVRGDDDFLQPVLDALNAHANIRIASFDHIVSYPSAILPIKRLVALCRDRGIISLVDGAHALGWVPLVWFVLFCALFVAVSLFVCLCIAVLIVVVLFVRL